MLTIVRLETFSNVFQQKSIIEKFKDDLLEIGKVNEWYLISKIHTELNASPFIHSLYIQSNFFISN